MWKTSGGGEPWPDRQSLIGVSDDILCRERVILDQRLGAQNAVDTCLAYIDRSENKDFVTEKFLLTARRAGCGNPEERRNGGTGSNWLLPVCPVPSFANNVVTAVDSAVCAPRHQAFLNQTRRGTGTELRSWQPNASELLSGPRSSSVSGPFGA